MCYETSGTHSCWLSIWLINYIAETNNLFSRYQAGFCKGWICEDQIIWIVQATEYDFQQRPMQHSILTLLDFSKAYDMVWREILLLHTLDTGIPSTFVRWIRSFFNDHRASIPVEFLLNIYLKVPFSPCYSSCSTSAIYIPCLTMMQL